MEYEDFPPEVQALIDDSVKRMVDNANAATANLEGRFDGNQWVRNATPLQVFGALVAVLDVLEATGELDDAAALSIITGVPAVLAAMVNG